MAGAQPKNGKQAVVSEEMQPVCFLNLGGQSAPLAFSKSEIASFAALNRNDHKKD